MLRQSALFASVLAIASSAVAGPLRRDSHSVSSSGSQGPVPVFSMNNGQFDGSSSTISSFPQSQSFNNWGGISSLSDFDDFYGQDNFCGQQNSLQMSGETVVCQSSPMNYIQQQYAVIGEYAKQVLLTNVCEVEAQAVVWGQFMGMLQSFQNDFMHLAGSSRPPTFDSNIAGHINGLCDDSGNIQLGDLGFSGDDVGSHCVQIEGLNWNPQTSPESCGLAWSSCQSVISSSLSAPICAAPPPSSICSSESAPPPTIIDSPPSIISGSDSDCDNSTIVDSTSTDSSLSSTLSDGEVATLSDGSTSTLSDGSIASATDSAGDVLPTGSDGSAVSTITPEQASNIVDSASATATLDASPSGGIGVQMLTN